MVFKDDDDWLFSASEDDLATAQWGEMLSSTHLPWNIDELTTTRDPFAASARKRYVADLILVDCACSPNVGHRGLRQIRETDGEYLVVLMTLSGSELVRQGERESQLYPGSIVVWDSESPASFRVQENLSKRSLFVPKSALGELGKRGVISDGVVLDSSSTTVSLLSGYLGLLSTSVDRLPLVAIPAARNATIELLTAALNPDSIVGYSVSSTRSIAESYVDRHLRDHDLTPHSVSQAIGVSIRSLHRAFDEGDETVSGFIRTRRLTRARDELGRGESITQVASRWQFSDASHFARLFKAAYQMTPREYSQRI